MNSIQIVMKFLEENKCDGLTNGECGCSIDDLQPCDEDFSQCVPAKKITFKKNCGDEGHQTICCDGECDWHMVEVKLN